MSSGTVTLAGTGLHSGKPARIVLERADAPVSFVTPRGSATIADLVTLRTDRGVRVACPRTGLDVDGIEHLLAALGGLAIRHGLRMRVDGGEAPLLDGAALRFCDALLGLGIEGAEPLLAIERSAELRHGDSVYRFEPGNGVTVHAEVDFRASGIGRQAASWNGTPDAFVRDIAWARTFGFVQDRDVLSSAGRARGVTPEAVILLNRDGKVLPECPLPRAGEFGRHKLLDLVGDLYLQGGPPSGTLHAVRPGHTATRAIFGEALERGVVAPRSGPRRPRSL